MNKNNLKASFEYLCRTHYISALAEDIVKDMIQDYDSFQELYDNYPFEVERALTYYSDSFNYLMDENLTDYTDAINWGATDITSIAYYFLTEEISNILAELDEDLWKIKE